MNRDNYPATRIYHVTRTSLLDVRQVTGRFLHQRLSAIWRRILVAQYAIYFFGIVIIFLAHVFHLNVVVEDAYITYQFARHLADGHGIVWNIDEGPVEGYTNFLWLLLSTVIIRSRLNVMQFTQLLGILASLATLGYTYRFGRKILNLPPRYALIPCLFLAVSGPFAAWASSGMEINLFGMFLLAGSYYFASWLKFGSNKDLTLSFLMLFLATLTRPEGFMIFCLIIVLGLVFAPSELRFAWKHSILSLSVYVIPFFIYFFWRYDYFGYLLPNTFYAKTGGGFYQYLRGVKYIAFFAIHFLLPLVPVLFILLWEQGSSRLRGVKWPSIRKHLMSNPGIYICFLVIIVYTLYIVYVGGDYMAMYRFFVPVLPFIYLLVGAASNQILMNLPATGNKQILTFGVLVFMLGLTIIQSTPVEGKLFHKPDFMHGTYQGIQYERWHVARYKVIADFFSEYRQSPQDSLALGPIGVISYFTDMTIYSFYGIVDPYIAHEPMSGFRQVLAGHEKYDLAYVLEKKPNYVVYSLGLGSEPETYPSYSSEVDKILQENYQLKSVWLDDRINSEAGFFTFLELK